MSLVGPGGHEAVRPLATHALPLASSTGHPETRRSTNVQQSCFSVFDGQLRETTIEIRSWESGLARKHREADPT
jgi:hypothetical protein